MRWSWSNSVIRWLLWRDDTYPTESLSPCMKTGAIGPGYCHISWITNPKLNALNTYLFRRKPIGKIWQCLPGTTNLVRFVFYAWLVPFCPLVTMLGINGLEHHCIALLLRAYDSFSFDTTVMSNISVGNASTSHDHRKIVLIQLEVYWTWKKFCEEILLKRVLFYFELH